MKTRLTFPDNYPSPLLIGDLDLLNKPWTAILNSSQSKEPCGSDLWIQNTCEAVRFSQTEELVLLSSISPNTWDLVTYLAGQHKIPLVLVSFLASSDDPQARVDSICAEFALSHHETLFVFFPLSGKPSKKEWTIRDEIILRSAEYLIPVSTNPTGKISQFINSLGFSGKVPNQFTVPYELKNRTKPYQYNPIELKKIFDSQFRGHLIHWTRACHGPWPGEKTWEYFKDVLVSGKEYARSARKTLTRIISEKRLRASSWRIRGSHPVVCFSALCPSDATLLMRWRSRYVRYSIEPLGISLPPDSPLRDFIFPVVYGDSEFSDIPVWLRQSEGKTGYWPVEAEHRHLGDLLLSGLEGVDWNKIELPQI